MDESEMSDGDNRRNGAAQTSEAREVNKMMIFLGGHL
jgi:hypothetical protein